MTEGDNNEYKLFKTTEETDKPEISELVGLPLPEWAQGIYLKIGPGKWDLPNGFKMNHWLDGYCVLSKFNICEKQVTFEKKFLQSDSYLRALKNNKPVINEFGTSRIPDKEKGVLSRVMSAILPESTDNCNSSWLTLGNDGIFATFDSNFFRAINVDNLCTGEKCDGNKFFGVHGQSAHPLKDEDTGDIFNVGFTILPSPKYQVFKMSPRLAKNPNSYKDMLKTSKIIATIPCRWSSSLGAFHSFGLTKNYLIFVEQPHVIPLSRILHSYVKNDSVAQWLEWRPEDKNRFIIIEKRTGKKILECSSKEAFYFLHVVNSYEIDDNIVMDIITYNSPNVLETMYMSNLRKRKEEDDVDLPKVERFIIPIIHDIKNIQQGENLISKSLKQKCTSNNNCTAVKIGNQIILTQSTITSNFGLEMPTINKTYFAKSYNFLYAAGTFNNSFYKNTIAKVNVNTRDVIIWKDDVNSEYLYPGEPMFLHNPKYPNNNDESNGIVVSAVTDCREGKDDFLLFLNAEDMSEIARAKFKSHIPSSVHGLFLPMKL